MKLLTRDTSAFRFLTLGGLLSKHDFLETIERSVPPEFEDANYRPLVNGFGVNEENVRRFVMNLLRSLRWETVEREHDVLAKFGDESILVECKRHDSRLLYIDEHRGGSGRETAIEELQRNLIRTGIKWGLLTDGVTFRFVYNAEIAPDLFDCYLEFSLKDMVDSTHRWPFEMSWLIDFLMPVSLMRRKDPTSLNALSKSHLNKILRVLKDEPRGLFTVIKSLAVAALEDMGVRPLHTEIKSIKSAVTKDDFLSIFSEIESDDPDFHKDEHFITNPLCAKIHDLLTNLADVDLSHVDHEFFGIVYQKFINNGNASHYTSTKLSREMANYIACRSAKTQMPNARAIYLEEDDFILDPALGSGQLLRGLLPFHRIFFQGNSSGIDGWRSLAKHFMGRDIDENAIWIAKINIWLATADKGEPLVKLNEFKPLNVISATIDRPSGHTVKRAFGISDDKTIAACVSNPPWDAFRGQNYDREREQRTMRALGIRVKQLNLAQIFLGIIAAMGDESAQMRFAVILPDSFFLDKNDSVRALLRGSLDFYFSYPKNIDPDSGKKIFEDVDPTKKFGIIFGRSQTNFTTLACFPYGKETSVEIGPELSSLGDHQVFPLLGDAIHSKIITNWRRLVNRYPHWHQGEFHPSKLDVNGRELSPNGRYMVLSGTSFCDETSPWSKFPLEQTPWKRMRRISESDLALRNQARTVFSDYINNSSKLNSASYIPENSETSLTDTVLYALNTENNDWLIYDSIIFGVLVQSFGLAQHIGAWRLSALGLPARIRSRTSMAANVELCRLLELTLEEATSLYSMNKNWLESQVSFQDWQRQIADLPAARQERENLQSRVNPNRRRTARANRR